MSTTKPAVKTLSYEDTLTEMVNLMEDVHNRNTESRWMPAILNSSKLMWCEDCFTFINGRLVPDCFCSCGCLEVYKAYRKIIEEAHR